MRHELDAGDDNKKHHSSRYEYKNAQAPFLCGGGRSLPTVRRAAKNSAEPEGDVGTLPLGYSSALLIGALY